MVIVLLAFMGGLRPSLVVALSIPFSVLFATLAMGYFGISANLMSLGGLAIAIGMMVDGAIVMAENVDRLLHETDPDEPRHRTVARACREVARPILFAITIVVIVFPPLFTLQGVEGKTFPATGLHGGTGHVRLTVVRGDCRPGVRRPVHAPAQSLA